MLPKDMLFGDGLGGIDHKSCSHDFAGCSWLIGHRNEMFACALGYALGKSTLRQHEKIITCLQRWTRILHNFQQCQ